MADVSDIQSTRKKITILDANTEETFWSGLTLTMSIPAEQITEIIKIGETCLVVFVERQKPRCFQCGQKSHIQAECARVDCVGSQMYRTGNPCFLDLLSRFQLADPYRLEFPNAPRWTWSNSRGSSRYYIECYIRVGQ